MAMMSFAGSERRLPSLVLSQFQTGLQRLDKLMAALQGGDCNVKHAIENAYASFSKAESELEDHIHHQTKKCREEEAELSRMQSRHHEIVKSLAGLSDSLVALSKTLMEQRRKVESAQQDVENSYKDVRKAEEEYEQARRAGEGIRVIGESAQNIPFVGSSIQRVSVKVYEEFVGNARHCLDSAQSNLSNATDALRHMERERENTQDDISRRKKEKIKMEEEMEIIQEKISTYRNDINEQNRTLTALRKVMTRLGKVSGRAEVLKDATTIMHDIAEIGIPLKSLFDSLEEFITQPDLWKRVLASPVFQAICDDDDDEDDEW